MFFKMITVILITIGGADNRMLLSELEREQELPALGFNGHVLFPKIYKFANVDQYSTLSSILRPIRSALPNIFRKLQYAPLHEKASQQNKNTDAEYTDFTPTPTSGPSESTDLFPDKKSTQLYAKSHLEPRPEATDTKCYATGYKVEASVSRSPGHNAVYRITPAEPFEIQKPVKVLLSQTGVNPASDVGLNSVATIVSSNLYGGVQTGANSRISDYVKPIGINLKLETLLKTNNRSHDHPFKHVDRPLRLTNERFVKNPDIVETVITVQDKSKRYTPHAKYHRLHLNIARVYSPGQVPPKSAVFPGNYGSRKPHPQVYIPQAYPDLNLNTMLFPVKHHRKGYRFRPSIIHL